jgi:hypothetical protein
MSFLNPLIINKFNYIYNDEIVLTRNNISQYYKYFYFLIKINKNSIPCQFYNLEIEEVLYNSISSNFIIHKIESAFLKNECHFNSILYISKENLLRYNIFNYNLDDYNIVVPIININYHDFLLYMNQFNNYTLININKLLILNSYNKMSDKYINKSLYNIISNINNSNFWIKSKILSLNLTLLFNKRKFIFNYYKLNNKEISFIMKTKIFNKNNIHYFDMPYSKKYVDLSILIKNTKMYKNIYNTTFNKQEIFELFTKLDNKNQYFLFSNLLLHTTYCYNVFNNYELLKLMLPTIKKYAYLYRYLFSYTWLLFYMDECVKKSYIKTDDPFIFDINTASLLLVFPFVHSNPKENPYMPILVNDIDLEPNNNLCGIDNNLNLGICNLEEFKSYLNIFCTGNASYNLFENINFKDYNMALSGSIIPACIHTKHPLMNNFSTVLRYYEEYYSESDIDIMFNKLNIFEFINNSYKLYKNICKNISKCFKAKNHKTTIILNKVAYLFVSKKYINNLQIKSDNKIKYIEENIEEDSIKILFNDLYQELTKKYINNLLENNNNIEEYILNDIKNIENYNFKIFFTDTDSNIVYNYKYQIKSYYLPRPLELFQVKYDDFLSVVSQFHLPCVRGYYDGFNVYLTPSCISSHMTFMNLDRKYFTSKKDPLEIINYYRLRGFGTWLSSNEKKLMIKYYNEIIFWRKLDEVPSKLFGTLSLNSKFFKPRLYNAEYYKHLLPIKESSYIHPSLLYNDYKIFNCNNKKINYNDFKCINNEGSITPFNKGIIELTWSINN